jgi:hypothetical protein
MCNSVVGQWVQLLKRELQLLWMVNVVGGLPCLPELMAAAEETEQLGSTQQQQQTGGQPAESEPQQVQQQHDGAQQQQQQTQDADRQVQHALHSLSVCAAQAELRSAWLQQVQQLIEALQQLWLSGADEQQLESFAQQLAMHMANGSQVNNTMLGDIQQLAATVAAYQDRVQHTMAAAVVGLASGVGDQSAADALQAVPADAAAAADAFAALLQGLPKLRELCLGDACRKTILWEMVHAQPQQADEQQQLDPVSNGVHITSVVLAAAKAVDGQLMCLSFCNRGWDDLGLPDKGPAIFWQPLLLGLQNMQRLWLLCVHGPLYCRKMLDSNGAVVDVLEHMRKMLPWCKVVVER